MVGDIKEKSPKIKIKRKTNRLNFEFTEDLNMSATIEKIKTMIESLMPKNAS